MQTTKARISVFGKPGGVLTISMLKQDKKEFDRVIEEYHKFIDSVTEQPQDSQSEKCDDSSPDEDTNSNSSYNVVNGKFKYKLNSVINLRRTIIMTGNKQQTIQ
jgi:hypothetical protein